MPSALAGLSARWQPLRQVATYKFSFVVYERRCRMGEEAVLRQGSQPAGICVKTGRFAMHRSTNAWFFGAAGNRQPSLVEALRYRE